MLNKWNVNILEKYSGTSTYVKGKIKLDTLLNHNNKKMSINSFLVFGTGLILKVNIINYLRT